MAAEWSTAALEELVDDILDRRGVTPLKLGSDFTSAGHRVISAKLMKESRLDLSADEPRFVDAPTYKKWMQTPLLVDDVILTSEAPLGEIAYIKEKLDWCLGQRLFGIRTNKSKLFGRFLFYALKSEPVFSDLTSRATGTTVQGIRQSELRRVQIPVPPLAEQKAIAAVLGALDDKIELNRRMNANLEAMARALFKSWFVDFDPVRAKLEGRKPEGLDEATAALFPDSLQESPLGHIPTGWDVCPLSEKIQLLSGGTPKTSEPTYWNGDIPWYSVRDAPSETDVWVIHTDKHVSKLGIAHSAAQVFPEKTTIISARGTVGKLALTAVPMAMNQSCYGVRGITGYGDYFTYYLLREATSQLQQRTHGTVFDTITTETFETLDCIFPTPKITAAFDKLVEPLLGQIRAKLHQSRTLATLRDTLLPKLLSGELSVDKIKEGLVA